MISLFFVFTSILFLYITSVTNTIYGGDAGDLVSAILTKGFAHPPGYPLYTLIGRLFINFPINYLTPAGKITLISSISTVCSFILVYLILTTLIGKKINKPIAIATILIVAVNYLIWLYAIVPEVFPLNVLITLGILFSALKFKRTGNINWLALILFLIGLGASHHHTFILMLPSVFILTKNQIKKILFSFKKILIIICSLLFGLLPLLYLPLSFLGNPEIIWGEANSIKGFIAILTRQAYGSFVPGSFISDSPIHRFIQLINLNNFVLGDFTLVGYSAIIIGLIILYRSTKLERIEGLSLSVALILFGPFFVFYANFPLGDKFALGTVERFLIIFYFLLAFPLYLGLEWFFVKIVNLLKSIVGVRYKVFLPLVFLVFYIFPVGLAIKNYRLLNNLKNYSVTEKLGEDILNSASKNSIIMLYSDTPLFNTQYVYYSNKNAYPGKVLIHTSKMPTEYYQKVIRQNYPKIIFQNKKNYNLGDFINDNIKNYEIFSTDEYAFPPSFPYKWTVQGLLYKLVPKDYEDNFQIEKNIKSFWDNAENKHIGNYYLANRNYWSNYFTNDVLRIYAIAHQNTAFYYLSIDKPELALPHIKEAIVLNPNDYDNYYILSIHYLSKKNCNEAEKSILKSLTYSKFQDKLYINQLEKVADCYTDQNNIDRIKNMVKKIKKSNSTPLKKI